jgi:hypothetical protein
MTIQYAFQQALGYAQFTGVSTSVAVSLKTGVPNTGATGIPNGANSALISVESAAIRWTDDPLNPPTTAVGQPVAAGAAMVYAAQLPLFKFIGQSGSPTVNVTYYA